MLPRRLAEALAAAGLTQASLARTLGVSTSTVSKWLCGARTPRDHIWPQIERALGRPRMWFYSDPSTEPQTAEVDRLREQTEQILARLRKLEARSLNSDTTVRVPLLDTPPPSGAWEAGQVREWVDVPLSVLNDAAGERRQELYALRSPISAVVEGKTVGEGVVVIDPGGEIGDDGLFAYQDAEGELVVLRHGPGLRQTDVKVLGRIVAVYLLP